MQGEEATCTGMRHQWVPRTNDYRSWHYVLDCAPGDILTNEPFAQGTWPELGSHDAILRMASNKIGIWHRDPEYG